MRNNVTFHYPAEFVSVSEDDGILSIEGAVWFVSLLRQIEGLSVRNELCQEDWGVVVFAERNGKRFWIGLSFWPEGEQRWLAHFHHHSFAWFQHWSSDGKNALERLIIDFHSVLIKQPLVRDVAWYEEKDMRKADPPSSAIPNVD